MGFKPEGAGGRERIYAGSLPPPLFIAAAMDLTVMAAAERHRELIADFATERTRLRIVVIVPFVILICFGLTIINYDMIGKSFEWPPELPLQGLLSPPIFGAAIFDIGQTV